MVAVIRQLLLCTLLVGTAGVQAAQLSAEVDRSEVTVGDTVTLTIRLDDSGGGRPDLNGLDEDFERLGSSQSSRHMIRNGRAESWTEWQISLLPRRSGSLTIPPIEVAGERTKPITVQVSPAPPPTAEAREAVFVEAEVNSGEVYVGQQLLFTVRVYTAVQLSNQSLTEPAFDNALIRQLAHHRFRRQLGNNVYQVDEIRYAIFPQQPGELLIPEVMFSGVEQVARRSMFTLPGQGRAVRRMSEQLRIEVRPIPAAFPADATWLPASDLQLKQRWSSDPAHAEEGASLTRTLTLRAEGVSASQLPEIPAPKVAGLKLYPDQPELETLDSDAGVTAVSTTGIAIIPARPGLITLPAQRIPWWDVEQDELRELVIPATTLRVAPAPAGLTRSTPPSTTGAPPAASAPAEDGLAANAPAVAEAFRWQLLALCTSLGWLITVLLWWYRARRNPSVQPVSAQHNKTPSEKSAFNALRQRCKAGDAPGARQAVLAWARLHWQQPELHTLDQIAALSDDPTLRTELQQLNESLYGGDEATAWRGNGLLKAVQGERRGRPTEREESTLPPLYPRGG